jgi:hypothetical protein
MVLWNLVWGCAVALAVSRRPLAEGGLGSYPRPVHVGYMVDIVARGRVFLPVLRISPWQHHSTNASCPLLYIRCLR